MKKHFGNKDINFEYVKQVPIKEEDYQTLIGLGRDYLKEKGSKTMKELLDGESIKSTFIKLIPKK